MKTAPKRLLSALLVLALLLLQLPTTALAEEAEATLSEGSLTAEATASAEADHGTLTFRSSGGRLLVTVTPETGYDLCTLRYTAGGSDIYVSEDAWVPSGSGYIITLEDPAVQDSVTATFFNTQVWDGCLDVSWYSSDSDTFYLSNPAQLAGLAAIVNGIYNTEITRDMIRGDVSCIQDCTNTETGSGSYGLNNSTPDYHYGADDFNGKTVLLTCDLDMGGVCSGSSWSGEHNYMPIGGQYLMDLEDTGTKLGSSFNGTLDGQGYTVRNIYCNRYNQGDNYGDGSSVGLIGRLGVHDNDPESLRAYQPTVRNISVTGYIYARRSVGGIVGKIGKTQYNNSSPAGCGAVIENCANYATIRGTDAKGTAGICGSAWNGGIIRCCVNYGSVTSSYAGPCGGIAGYNEVSIINCYNVGYVTNTSAGRYAEAIGSDNGGSYTISNCYYLRNSAAGGGYYSLPAASGGGVTECTDEYMKSSAFVDALNSGSRSFCYVEGSYPVLRCTLHADSAAVTGVSITTPMRTDYLLGETIDVSALVLTAAYSDGTGEAVDCYTVSAGGSSFTVDHGSCSGSIPLTQENASSGSIIVCLSGSWQGLEFSLEVPCTVTTDVTPEKLTVSGLTHRTYVAGDTPDLSGATVSVVFRSGDSTVTQTITDYTVTPAKLSAGDNSVTVSFTMNGSTVSTTAKVRVVAAQPAKEGDTWLIASEEDLIWFAAQVNEQHALQSEALLTTNLDFSSVPLTPIGCDSSHDFAGTIDGDGHTITLGSFCSASLETLSSGLALCGYTKNAKLKNLTIAGSISGSTRCAALIAQDTGYTTVTDCTVTAAVSATGSSGYAGGITAYVSGPDSVYQSCSSTGSVTAKGSSSYGTGGILGSAGASVTVSGCNSSAAVTVNTGIAGGIVGMLASGGSVISDCSNAGTVSASLSSASGLGGILGRFFSADSGRISYCANSGRVTSSGACVGGILGSGYSGCGLEIENSCNTAAVSGSYTVGGIAGQYAHSIRFCYNTGAVSSTSTGSSYGTGGLLGLAPSAMVLEHCYNAGTVTAGANPGALVGYAKNYLTADSLYYLAGTAANAANAASAAYIAGLPTSGLSASDMQTAAFVGDLNGSASRSFVMDSDGSNSGYPVLRFQTGEDTAHPVSVSCSTEPQRSYVEGQSFSTDDMVLTVYYSDGSSCAAAPETLSISADAPLTTQDSGSTVTVSGSCAGIVFSFSFTITVSADSVRLLAVTTPPQKTVYGAGEAFDPTGMELTATYYSGATRIISAADCSISPAGALSSTGSWVTLTYGGQQATQNVTVTTCPMLTAVDGVYRIGSAEELFLFAALVNERGQADACGMITADLDATALFSTIGTSDVPFTGTLDGDGHTITLSVNLWQDCMALVSFAGGGAYIHDLTVSGSVTGGAANTGALIGSGWGVTLERCGSTAAVTGTENTGGLAGTLYGGSTVTDCSCSGTVTPRGDNVGGLVGYAADTVFAGCSSSVTLSCSGRTGVGGIVGSGAALALTDCSNSGPVSGSSSVGGILGACSGGAGLTDCSCSGTVTGTGTGTGGILGTGDGSSTLSGCLVTGAVSGGSYTGGIAGSISDTDAASLLERCGSYGGVTAGYGSYVGGLVGSFTGSSLRLCAVSCDVSGRQQVGGLVGQLDCGAVTDCYAAGALKATSGGSGTGLGGFAGYVSGQSTAFTGSFFYGTLAATTCVSGTGVGFAAADLTFADCRCSSGLTAGAVGDRLDSCTVTGAPQGCENAAFPGLAEALGSSYQESCPYPVLSWETAQQHVWDAGTVTTAATATTDGDITYTCSRCGATRTEAIPASACEHSWGSWSTVTPSTASVQGTKKRSCSLCGAEETALLPLCAFTDLNSRSYYYLPVLWAVENRITSGTSKTTFEANAICTRAQAVTFLWRLAGCPEVSGTGSCPFTDVRSNSFYYTAVLWGYQNNIVRGTSGTTFEPDAAVTRAQFITFLWRYAGQPDSTSATSPFRDVSAGYYYTPVLWGYENGIVQGTSSDLFSPKDYCKRAQVVTFMYRWALMQ